jgi:hypothetical protein
MVTATTKLAVFQIGLINETAHLVTYVETPAGKSIIRDEVLPAGIDQISGEVLLGTARYIFVLGRPDIRRIEYAADGKRFVTPVTVPVSSVAEGWAIFKAGGESAQERIRLSRCSGCQADYLGPIDRSDA